MLVGEDDGLCLSVLWWLVFVLCGWMNVKGLFGFINIVVVNVVVALSIDGFRRSRVSLMGGLRNGKMLMVVFLFFNMVLNFLILLINSVFVVVVKVFFDVFRTMSERVNKASLLFFCFVVFVMSIFCGIGKCDKFFCICFMSFVVCLFFKCFLFLVLENNSDVLSARFRLSKYKILVFMGIFECCVYKRLSSNFFILL